MNQQATQIKIGDIIQHKGKSLRFKGILKAAYPWSDRRRLMPRDEMVDDCRTDFLRREVVERMGGKEGYEMMNMYANAFEQGIYCQVAIFEYAL